MIFTHYYQEKLGDEWKSEEVEANCTKEAIHLFKHDSEKVYNSAIDSNPVTMHYLVKKALHRVSQSSS